MLTKFDKAYTALLVSFISATVLQFTGIAIDPVVQSGIIAVLTAGLTWLVPNKP
jgi:hypothetical protein